ncbi:MAG: Mini-ribonuclease 3 [Oscillospiraceae bacterium]|nr:Mini-ribonuclease 3 [Oscillospiraceae bacterium]
MSENGIFTNATEYLSDFGLYKDEAADPDILNPLVLAFIGDSVFDLYIRTMLVVSEKGNVNKLHRAATEYVRSGAQARIAKDVVEMLNEKEKDILRRGRNTHSGYVPKNAIVSEYRYATGFEALVGYLYLKGNMERLIEILKFSTYGKSE